MEKSCPNCHLQNSPDALFCRQCATPLAAASVNQPPIQPIQYQNPPNQAQYQNPQWNPQAGGFQANVQPVQQTGESSSRATTAAILAVAGVLCCGFLTGIPAAILGWLEMGAIREGRASAKGMTMAQIGLWGGIIGTVLHFIGYFLLMIMSMMNRGY